MLDGSNYHLDSTRKNNFFDYSWTLMPIICALILKRENLLINLEQFMRGFIFAFITLYLPNSGVAETRLTKEQSESISSESEKIEVKKDAVYSEFTPDAPAQVYSRPCPFDCNSEGFSHSHCKEWKLGERCFIGPKKE